MSVLRCDGSFRVSFHDRFTEPSEGSTASHWLNWSLATPAGSSFDPQRRAPGGAAIGGAGHEDVGAAGGGLVHPGAVQRSPVGPGAGVGPARRVHQGAPAGLGGDGDGEGHLSRGDGAGGPEALAPVGRARLHDRVVLDVMPGDMQGPVWGHERVGSDDRLGPLPVPLAATGVENVRPPSVDRLTRMTSLAEDLPAFRLALSQAT